MTRIHLNRPADILTRGDESIEDESILLYPGHAVRLGTLGTEIARQAREPVSIEDLSVALEARFGQPEGISLAEAVGAVVTELTEQGVLTVE